MAAGDSVQAFYAARGFLFAHRDDYDTAYRDFRWPELDTFNWALDHIDAVAADPVRGARRALWIVEQDGSEAYWTFAELAERSNRVANRLREWGVQRGDRIVLMLGNQVELWETLLAAMKLGAVVIPATTQLRAADLRDRLDRGGARHVVVAASATDAFAELPGDYTRIAVGGAPEGWLDYAETETSAAAFTPDGVTRAADPLLLYFTSGTTARPKLVEHTHASYPVGHLSTMYWIGLEPGDVHLNISSPGWAKHAWSNVFAPLTAEACVLVMNFARFDAAGVLDVLDRCRVTSFCAPPTVWRMLIQADLSGLPHPPAKVVGAGEPLNPEVIEQVERAWGVRIRDGFGQTETTRADREHPGAAGEAGVHGPARARLLRRVDRPVDGRTGGGGRDLPGAQGAAAGADGRLRRRRGADRRGHGRRVLPHGRRREARRRRLHHLRRARRRRVQGAATTGSRPFELESVLIEHPAVAEAAVVPSPDALRLAVPKAFVVLAAGYEASADTARSILEFARDNLAPYQRIRRLEFAELPKTISGKIRRVELRGRETTRSEGQAPAEEFTL